MVAGVSVLPTWLVNSMVVKTESREPDDNKQQTELKSLKTQAPSGGPFGIDQEVVTLRGLSRQLPGQGPKHKTEVPG